MLCDCVNVSRSESDSQHHGSESELCAKQMIAACEVGSQAAAECLQCLVPSERFVPPQSEIQCHSADAELIWQWCMCTVQLKKNLDSSKARPEPTIDNP